jgi:sodium-dependent dicarboxylate transporter 2/3/5
MKGIYHNCEQPSTNKTYNFEKLFCKNQGFILSVAYAASVGGAGSLIGTTPNLVLKGYFDANYPTSSLNFITYMAFAAPISFLVIFITWAVMCFTWIPWK